MFEQDLRERNILEKKLNDDYQLDEAHINSNT